MAVDLELLKIAEGIAESIADPGAETRFRTYQIPDNGYYSCPACWVQRGALSLLLKDESTSLRCSFCGRIFTLSVEPLE